MVLCWGGQCGVGEDRCHPSLVPLTLSLCSVTHHPASVCMDRSPLLHTKMLQLLPGAA